MKTYKLRAVDYVGAVYDVGFFLSSSPAEASERARREWGPQATAEEVQDVVIDSIDKQIAFENELTHKKLAGKGV